MSDILDIRLKIQKMRESMQQMITSNDDLISSEILELSKMLDDLLNDYERMLRRRK